MLFVAKSKHLLERYLVKVFCPIYVIAKKRKIILFYPYNQQRAIDREGWAVGVAALWGYRSKCLDWERHYITTSTPSYLW